MKINMVNSLNFEAKKFRLPVKKAIFGPPEYHTEESVNWVKEFSNPNAKALYQKALETNNLKEKIKLFEEMGEYRLIDVENNNLVDNFFKKLMKAP